jgi:hypothetical protein
MSVSREELLRQLAELERAELRARIILVISPVSLVLAIIALVVLLSS